MSNSGYPGYEAKTSETIGQRGVAQLLWRSNVTLEITRSLCDEFKSTPPAIKEIRDPKMWGLGEGSPAQRVRQRSSTQQVTPQVQKLLASLSKEMTRTELMDSMGFKDRMHFTREYLLPAIEAGLVEMTMPGKPNSRLQKYRLAQKGQDLIAKLAKEAGTDGK